VLGRHRLFIRDNHNTPHFYCLTDRDYQVIERKESSPLHNDRVNNLLEILQQQEELVFYYRSFSSEDKEFVELFKGEEYSWGKEVTRCLSDTYWRHDIFGANSRHRHTKNSPWVAIEVIDSNFPSEAALEAWLTLSSDFPYFILFDFVKVRNYFFQIDIDKRRARVVYFIHDGALWRSGTRLDNCTAALFKEKVNEEIYKKLK